MSIDSKSWLLVSTTAIAVIASSAVLAQDTQFMKNRAANTIEHPSALAIVKSSVRYQAQRTMICNTGVESVCLANFPTLSAKQRIELQNVSCLVQTEGGTAKGAYASYSLPSGDFYLPLGLGFQSSIGAFSYYTFQQATSMYIPPTKSLRTIVGFGGTSLSNSGFCEIFGQFITME